MDSFRCKILKDLANGKHSHERWVSYRFPDESADTPELMQQVTDELIALWKQGYIEANVDHIDPEDKNSPWGRPTNIQLTDKGLQAIKDCS